MNTKEELLGTVKAVPDSVYSLEQKSYSDLVDNLATMATKKRKENIEALISTLLEVLTQGSDLTVKYMASGEEKKASAFALGYMEHAKFLVRCLSEDFEALK